MQEKEVGMVEVPLDCLRYEELIQDLFQDVAIDVRPTELKKLVDDWIV